MKCHRNHGLFSNYYLGDLLPREMDWYVDVSLPFEKVKRLWEEKKGELSELNEPQLRRHFLDKVFELLGFTIDVEPPTPSGEWAKRPDYAFFKDKGALKLARELEKSDGYFSKALCIGEAKRWGRPLDKKLKTEAAPFEVQNPSLQMSRYLWLTGVRWGILTDGKYFRLYERETSKRLDIFYEVDLPELIEDGDLEAFKYFYLFFRGEAFPGFIEKVYRGSVNYSQKVGEELKENVYQALKMLAEGFLKTPTNNLTSENLKEIHDNSLIFLYRLLFILYAEHRGLLPLGEKQLYAETYSLDALKKEVTKKLDQIAPLATSTYQYWNKIRELFEIINLGNSELSVPPYNGGLFDSERHPFLEKYRAGDLYLAKVVSLLSRSQDKAFIDYGSLEIRHLGSIYEGLLEYKLKIADKDLVAVKEKGREVFVPLNEAKKVKEQEVIRVGELYLVTDKGERKATGSYYTPDYIVEYIVENTLDPLIDEKKKKVGKKIKELEERIKTSRGYNREHYKKELRKVEASLVDEILSIKVLDPAMGSGHFLVEATDSLALALLRALEGDFSPETGVGSIMAVKEELPPYEAKELEEEDIRWARREVVERCIFGVDLNPLAVELAKLSLWLYTVAKNRPLNFLDHHLRCGNSLIGARLEDLGDLPSLKKKEEGAIQLGLFDQVFREKVNILLGSFAQIELLPSDTVEQIREKGKLYQEFRKIVERFQDVADVWTSCYFVSEASFDDYQKLQDKLRASDKEWEGLKQEPWFKKSKEIAEERHFFHWELEFPEIFFEGHKRKENPGFDVVVGNPPWVSFSGRQSQALLPEDRQYYSFRYKCFKGWLSFHTIFGEKAFTLLKTGGYHSFIVPDQVGYLPNYKPFRELFYNANLVSVRYTGEEVFEDVVSPTLVYIASKQKIERVSIIYKEGTQLEIPTKILRQDPNFRWTGDRKYSIWAKLNNVSISLKENFGDPGVHTGNCSTMLILSKLMGHCEPIIEGTDVQRYNIPEPRLYLKLDYQPMRNEYFTIRSFDKYRNTSLVIRQTASYPIATKHVKTYFRNSLLAYFSHKVLSDNYILALLNSALLRKWYKSTFIESSQQAFPQVKVSYLRSLPIRRIAFVTPKKERDKFLKEFTQIYKELMKKIGSEEHDTKE